MAVDRQQEALGDWKDLPVGPIIGGLHTDIDSELIENNQLVVAKNAIVSYKELQSDTGYVLKGQIGLRGDPRVVVEYVHPTTNGLHTFLITNTTTYVFEPVTLTWQYPSNGTETTLNTAEAQGSTALGVTSITGFADTDFIGIQLDNGQMHFTQVSGAPAAGIINIAVGLASAAAIGKAVINSTVLIGSNSNHVTAIVIPWSGEVIFTNAIANNVKKFDPAPGLHGSVIDLTGTGLPANTQANSVALFDNSLVLAGLREGADIKLSRFRYSAKGDLTLWNTLEAGFTDLLENLGEIEQSIPLGPYLILYRRAGITRVSIGGAGRFTSDSAVAGLGAGVSSNLAAVDLVDKHLVWGTNKFFWYRGGFGIEELESPIRESIWGKTGAIKVSLISPQQVFPILLPYRNEVLFCWGSSTANIPYPRYNVEHDKWTTRLFENGLAKISGSGPTIGTFASTLGTIYLCDATDDKVVTYDLNEPDDDNETLSFEIQTKDFSHPSLLLVVDWFELKASGSGTLTVDFSTDQGTTWTSYGSAVLTSTPTRFRIHKQVTARLIRFRFTTTNPVVLAFFNLRHKFTAEW